jgi:rRNA maturation endonuclease Nob1
MSQVPRKPGLRALDSGKRTHLLDKTGARTLVLDTSALIMGLNPSALELPAYSVPSVAEELIPESLPYTRFGASRDSGGLIVAKPTASSISTVHEISSRVGDVAMLSNADVDVLALALDLKKSGLSPAIVSDDYAIQNVSETLEIEHASLATFGIARRFDWVYYCPACFRKYRIEDADQTCRVCGTHLKRKVVKKRKPTKKISRS